MKRVSNIDTGSTLVLKVRAVRAGHQLLGAALFLLTVTACEAQSQLAASRNVTPERSGYKTELFNLVDPSGDRYETSIGRAVSAAFEHLLNLSGKNVEMLRKHLLSGPATEGSRWEIGESRQWLYQTCQANRCNVTNVSMLYDASTHRTVGRLLFRCSQQWLGAPSDAEIALIESQSPIQIDADDAKIFCDRSDQ